MAKFLDSTGLGVVIDLMKETFALINHRHPNVTDENDGFMSKEDKEKLDNMQDIEMADVEGDNWDNITKVYDDEIL